MSRPRHSLSGPQPESFNVRWHSVVDPATPSADIMSSPDPLNEATGAVDVFPPSSSRRVTRSLRSQRFVSPGSSPRKQTFELQVGDNRSPQKLLVTVETDAGIRPASGGPRRRLFESPALTATPASRRRERAITTTIPLRDAIGEEPADAGGAPMTPRRRGRPRKSNGTPMPSAAKRRAGTPAKARTPRRPRITNTDEPGAPQSEASAQPTPRSTRRGRPPKDRAPEPPSDAGTETTPKASATRRSNRRRQAPAPEELVQLADSAGDSQPQWVPEPAAQSEDEIELIRAPSDSSADAPMGDAPLDNGPDSDIWMATLSNEATPRASAHPTQPISAPSPSERALATRQPEPERADPDIETSQAGDYVDLVSAPSDVSSIDEPVGSSARQANDTIAQGEDFSMIFMDSIPSLQGFFNSSIPPVAQEELGDETSLIINNTLESLRRSTAQRDAMGTSDPAEPPRPDPGRAGLAEDELASDEPTPVQPTASESPSRAPTIRWSRSPRKPAASSPLRHRVLRFTARQAEGSAAESPAKNIEDQTPKSSRTRRGSGRVDDEASNIYEDSFSEIPQEVLTAATPRRPYAADTYDDHDDVMDELQEGEEMELEEENEPQAEVAREVDQGHEEEPQPQEDPAYEEYEDLNRVPREATYEEYEDEGQVQREATYEEYEDENRVQEEATYEEYEELEEPPAPSNASTAARSDAGRLPTPDDTPPQAEVQDDEDQDKSSRGSRTPPQPASPLAGRTDLVVDAEDLPGPPQPVEQSELPQLPGLGRASTNSVEATPAHQMSSPLQGPLSLQQESLQDKTFRPALSAIVRAGRVLQSITSDPPSPEGRERQLGSPFRSSGSKESWNGSRDSQNSRRMSKSPQQPPLAFTERPAASNSPAREDPFTSVSHTTGQADFMQALGHGVGGPATKDPSPSRESVASSMRITPPSDDAMSWVVKEGPISPRLRGDNTLQQASRSSSTRAAKGTMSLGQLDKAVDEPDELNQEEPEARDDETDIWEFEAQRETPKSTRQRPFGKKVATSSHRRGGLPSPWARRRAAAPAILERDEVAEASNVPPRATDKGKGPAAAQASEVDEFSMLAQTQPQGAADKHAESASKAKGFELSSFFSSPAAIPGMLAQKFRPAATKSIFGPTASQPEPAQAPAPVMPTSSMFPQAPQKESRPSRSPRQDSSSPARAKEPGPQERPAVGAPSSPATPERIAMPSVAQKQNFTPRPGQASQAFFQASAQRAAAAAATPPRMQLSHADIHRWQQETSNAGKGSAGLNARPLLRPLPGKNASPTKSSLRSPLKPRTPGRVVEFTSSVLSPAEQARARQERRLSSSLPSQQQQQSAPPVPPPAPEAADDKENSNSNSDTDDAPMDDAPPLEKTRKKTRPAPLSRSVWTRQHWLFLDDLLQLRRRAPFDAGYEPRADRYLGKTVRSQGEAMRLERWHLDCIDAFRAEVGGWDEGVLAKRLFALILGEERRRRGVPARPSRVMFH